MNAPKPSEKFLILPPQGNPQPSEVTLSLATQLLERDAHGQSKYGTTLDRDDLTPEEWAQHLTEELLDGAGYATSLIRKLTQMRGQIAELHKAAQEYALLRRGLEQFMRDHDRPARYRESRDFQDGFATYEQTLQRFLLAFDSAQVLRQLKR